MSWAIEYKRYKSLVNKLLSINSELEFVQEVIVEYNEPFVESREAYIQSNKINRQALRFPEEQQPPEPQAVTPSDNTIHEPAPEKTKKEHKPFMGLYKLIAKKIHPDKFQNDPDREKVAKMTALFKDAGTAISEGNWARLLEICRDLDIKPLNLKHLNRQIEIEIDKLKDRLQIEKNKYGWEYYKCEEDQACKDRLLRRYVKQFADK